MADEHERNDDNDADDNDADGTAGTTQPFDGDHLHHDEEDD